VSREYDAPLPRAPPDRPARGIGVLMKWRGEPRTMQCDPVYDSPLIEVLEFRKHASRTCNCRRESRSTKSPPIDPASGSENAYIKTWKLFQGWLVSYSRLPGRAVGVSRKSTIARCAGASRRRQAAGALCAALSAVSARCSNSCGSKDVSRRVKRSPWRATQRVEPHHPGGVATPGIAR